MILSYSFGFLSIFLFALESDFKRLRHSPSFRYHLSSIRLYLNPKNFHQKCHHHFPKHENAKKYIYIYDVSQKIHHKTNNHPFSPLPSLYKSITIHHRRSQSHDSRPFMARLTEKFQLLSLAIPLILLSQHFLSNPMECCASGWHGI